MIMMRKTVCFYSMLTVSLLMIGTQLNAQVSDRAIVAAADTSFFKPNTPEGWSIMLGYLVSVGNDSVRLEVVLFREDSVAWNGMSRVGDIKDKTYWPVMDRQFKILAGKDEYQILIKSTGSVWLELKTGQLGYTEKFIIPINVVYRR